MHILQSFCIAMFLVLFRHNKTPKVFCLTFGVHVNVRLAQGRFIFAVLKGWTLISPSKGSSSIKFTESLFVRGKSRRDQ